MKKLNLVLIFFVQLVALPSLCWADLDHICAYSNESVAKFRRKSVGSSIKDAIAYCAAENMIGSSKVQFAWPIDLCDFWVSSLFGPRTHRGVSKMHGGVDMAATKGTAVKASAGGKVIRAEDEVAGYGSCIEILHKGGMVTRYGHLDEMMVQQGDKVSKGDMIGTVGATGNVRGKSDPSHLHFEIMLANGKRVDPLKYLYCAEVAFQKP